MNSNAAHIGFHSGNEHFPKAGGSEVCGGPALPQVTPEAGLDLHSQAVSSRCVPGHDR